MTVKEAYLVLGLQEGATSEEVKRAYKEETFAWHPDRFTEGTKMYERAQEKIKILNEARSVLIDHLSGKTSRQSDAKEKRQKSREKTCQPRVWSNVIYLGKDPRLDVSSITAMNRQPVSVVITGYSILLVFSENQQIEYLQASLVDLTFSENHWSAQDASFNIEEYSWSKPQMDQRDVTFRAHDPEDVVPSFTISLRFPNDYWAKTFCKRAIAVFFPRNVIEWVKLKRKEEQREKQKWSQEKRQQELEKSLKLGPGLDFLAIAIWIALACFILAALVLSGPDRHSEPAHKINYNKSKESLDGTNPRQATADSFSEWAKHKSSAELALTGEKYHQQQKYLDAIDHYRMALSMNPDSIPATNNLAWILATCPDDLLRNGQEALKLARSLEEYAFDHQFPWSTCSTIAAAFAETGEFDAAVKWQRKSFENAPPEWKETQKDCMELYQGGQPYRETSAPNIVH